MKKFQSPEALTPLFVLLLSFATALKPMETVFIAPAMAQSSTDASPQGSPAPSPEQTVSYKDLLWWVLLLSLSGGLLWWMLTRSRSIPEIVPVAASVTSPIAPPNQQLPETSQPNPTPPPRVEINSSDPLTSAMSEKTIPLLEERLVVNFHRRKIGEVVVRKEVDVCIVEVPVRRERLIVEQISPKYEQLAVVDLGSASAEAIQSTNGRLPPTLQASFVSVNAAVDFLQSIDGHRDLSGSAPISVMLVDESLRSAYQKWLERHER
jgi:Domain of unknown function (DUF2382)